MQHLNGKLLCCIDTETTGLDPRFHEIWQLCILPLDARLNPSREHYPLLLLMKPEHPEYIDWNISVFKRNKAKIENAIERGHDQIAAMDLFFDWVEKLKRPMNKYGNVTKLEPLGQNYAFDQGFIQQWLSIETYNEYFDYHYRDLMHAALYMNDKASFYAEKVPFSKVSLNWICDALGVVNHDAHDALSDCKATAECYRRLCERKTGGLFNV